MRHNEMQLRRICNLTRVAGKTGNGYVWADIIIYHLYEVAPLLGRKLAIVGSSESSVDEATRDPSTLAH